MAERIWVSEETYAALDALKGEDESFDDVLSRIVGERVVAIHSGAGLWAGSDVPVQSSRSARLEVKESVGSRHGFRGESDDETK